MGMTKDEFRARVLADQAKRKKVEADKRRRRLYEYYEYTYDLGTKIVRKTRMFTTSHLRPGRGKG